MTLPSVETVVLLAAVVLLGWSSYLLGRISVSLRGILRWMATSAPQKTEQRLFSFRDLSETNMDVAELSRSSIYETLSDGYALGIHTPHGAGQLLYVSREAAALDLRDLTRDRAVRRRPSARAA